MRYLAADYDIKTKSVTKPVGIEVFCNNATSIRAFLGLIATLQGESGSSVSTVSGYGLDDREIEVQSPAEARHFPLASVSRPALGPSQSPVQWVPGVLSLGVKGGRGVTLTTHTHLVLRSRMSRSYTSSPPQAPPWRVAGRHFLATLQSLHNVARQT
jgi:hypothetical protein